MGSFKRSKKALKRNKRSKSARKMHIKIKSSHSSHQLLLDHGKLDHSYAMLESSGSIGCSLQRSSIHEDHLYCTNIDKSSLESSLAYQNPHSEPSCDSYVQSNSVEKNDSLDYGLTLLDEPTSGIECEIVEHEVFDGKESIYNNTSLMSPEIDLDSAWGTQEEFESVLNHKLCVEVEEKANTTHSTGNRIVNLQHVLDWALPLQVAHSRICTCGQLFLWKEEREGFVSHLFFKCTVCNRVIKKSTHPNVPLQNAPRHCEQDYTVNIGAVWGSLSTGNCHSHLEELCCVMDIPPMTYKKFHKIEDNLGSLFS